MACRPMPYPTCGMHPMSSQWHATPCHPMPSECHAATRPSAHLSILYHSLPLPMPPHAFGWYGTAWHWAAWHLGGKIPTFWHLHWRQTCAKITKSGIPKFNIQRLRIHTGGIAFGWHGVAMDLDGMGRQWIWMAWDSIQWHCCPMQCHPMPCHPNPLPPNAIPMQCGVGIGVEHPL